ncbi:hypothetical protein Tco_1505881 [Tanacetum coccineum]
MKKTSKTKSKRKSSKIHIGDKVKIKRPRDGADDDPETPPQGTVLGSKIRRSGKEPALPVLPSETTTRTADSTTDTDVL